jgi:hypothetical protein
MVLPPGEALYAGLDLTTALRLTCEPCRFNKTIGYVGAFPTYDEQGNITLRPVSRRRRPSRRVLNLLAVHSVQTDETCLMRDVTYPGEYLPTFVT